MIPGRPCHYCTLLQYYAFNGDFLLLSLEEISGLFRRLSVDPTSYLSNAICQTNQGLDMLRIIFNLKDIVACMWSKKKSDQV